MIYNNIDIKFEIGDEYILAYFEYNGDIFSQKQNKNVKEAHDVLINHAIQTIQQLKLKNK